MPITTNKADVATDETHTVPAQIPGPDSELHAGHVAGVLAKNAGITLNRNVPHSNTNVPENLNLGRKHGIS